MSRSTRALGWALGTGLVMGWGAACSSRASSTGGVELELITGSDGRACGHGVALIQTDYVSTNVALFDLSGQLRSASFIHSGSAEIELNAPLSGDVVFPSAGSRNELVLIDRYPASVISFVDTRTAGVRGQLNVRTGFDANPRDFVQLDDERALVSRYEHNPHPGDQDFDQGDDVLVVDPMDMTILERLDLGGSRDERMRPSALLALKHEVIVSLNRLDPTFGQARDAQLLVLDRDDLSEITRFTIDGLEVCEGLSLSPDESSLVVSCSGLLDQATEQAPPKSGLVVLDLAPGTGAWREVSRTLSADFRRGPLGFNAGHLTQDVVLVTALGALEGPDAGRPDSLLAFDLASKKEQLLLEAPAFALGGLICSEPCGLCYATDAEAELLHVVGMADSGDISVTSKRVDTGISLPPRALQLF